MASRLRAAKTSFLHGPPGTAKSALVHELARRLDARAFDYLLTRFTEPGELFGPFDIRKLREGDLVTNTEGMLPEAEFIFLDELLNANSAILNSLLLVLNERVFRRGRETRKLPALLVVSASNHLPEEEALKALFDRFLLVCTAVTCRRRNCRRVGGWLGAGEVNTRQACPMAFGRRYSRFAGRTANGRSGSRRGVYLELIARLRAAGMEVSDRRAVKLQRVIAASALMCGRMGARVSDLWVVRFIWDREEQREMLAAMVQETINKDAPSTGDHPQTHGGSAPDPESLARDLDVLSECWDDLAAGVARDRLAALAARAYHGVLSETREALQERWRHFGGRQAHECGGDRVRMPHGWAAGARFPASKPAKQQAGHGRGPGAVAWDLLPALARFTSDQGRLTPLGRRMPTERLPGGARLPLAEFCGCDPAAAALPALHVAPIAFLDRGAIREFSARADVGSALGRIFHLGELPLLR
ncbi:MAG: AAA family ATPase [Verrucomicrobiales bacterium]